jgi:LysM domain
MLIAAALLLLFFGTVTASEIRLAPRHPDHYQVMPGDTLWDIAGRFLESPWEWPLVWRRNPQIANPDLIYPGDVLQLDRTGGQTSIGVSRPSELRLSPQIRIDPTAPAIPTIRVALIRPFLTKPLVLTENDRSSAPRVVGIEEGRILGGEGDLAFVRSITARKPDVYSVVRPGQAYTDGDTGEPLGYEGLYVGDARLKEVGDPGTIELSRTEREASIGDLLMPIQPEVAGLYVYPRPPRTQVRGHIVGVLEGVYEIGQYHIVTLDRGVRDGLQVGHVLAIFQKGDPIHELYDTFASGVTAPEERGGELMVFRVFEQVSFALVLQARRAIHIGDLIRNP